MRLALSHAAEGAPGPRQSLQLSCCRRVAAGLEECSIRDLPQGVGSARSTGDRPPAGLEPTLSTARVPTMHTPGTHRAVMGASRSLAQACL